jgi:hypothetical protein
VEEVTGLLSNNVTDAEAAAPAVAQLAVAGPSVAGPVGRTGGAGQARSMVVAALLSIAGLLLFLQLRFALARPLLFDDAYMFYRYALEIRHGFGLSWNPGGGPVYGPTSLLWTACVWLLSFLPASPGKALVLGSWCCGAGAMVAMAWAASVEARSSWFTKVWSGLALIATPLLLCDCFRNNSLNGMDTALSTLLNAGCIGAVLFWARHPSPRTASVAGVWGLTAFLARPDSGLAFVLMTGLAAALLVPRGQSRKTAALVFAVLAGGVLVDLGVCQLIFHTALPLSFYLKSRNAYDGYAENWTPVLSAIAFLRDCSWFTFPLLVLAATRRQLRVAAVLLIPALVSALYYTFLVTQIVGRPSRYYVPLLPFVVVSAVLAVDGRIAAGSLFSRSHLVLRVVCLAALLLVLQSGGWLERLDEAMAAPLYVYDLPVPAIASPHHLPYSPWFDTQVLLTQTVLEKLPAGATVAASEVGYLGAMRPDLRVIDLSGLNNTGMALHGFNPRSILAEKPDLIWMPVLLYTANYGRLYSEPGLLDEYTVWDGMFNYGIAVRKQSPYRASIESNLRGAWARAYPGYRMDDYQVRSVTWNPQKHRGVLDEKFLSYR